MAITQIVSALVGLGASVKLSDNTYPRSRDLNNTPAILNQGDCPQLIHTLVQTSEQQISFSLNHKSWDNIVVRVYFVDESENLDQIWVSRPRVIDFIDDYLQALDLNNTLNGLVEYSWVSTSGANESLRYNGSPYRGAILDVHIVRLR